MEWRYLYFEHLVFFRLRFWRVSLSQMPKIFVTASQVLTKGDINRRHEILEKNEYDCFILIDAYIADPCVDFMFFLLT